MTHSMQETQNTVCFVMTSQLLLAGLILYCRNNFMSFFHRNPKGTVQGLNKVNNDVGQRAQNLSVLIYHIKSYYQETLHQLIMTPPPNVLLLGKNPVCGTSALSEKNSFRGLNLMTYT
uniref:Uncharacterized protein n=1 Tax=Sinocyclocheilus anshuiensis TaxID=1608454 RepID=A0A671S662_9TELE